MTNIVGEHFYKYVDEQVKVRQKIYAKRNRDNNDLEYMNGKTAWLKLVSSIDLDEEKARELGLANLTGPELAKNLVLFGGVTPHFQRGDQNIIQQLSGIAGPSNNIVIDSAYGFGNDQFGQRPMPGMLSATIKPKNRGSLREANIIIKAYNKKQLELLDAIYLRIGYTMLLEWGWSNYYDNNENYISNPINNSLAWEFLNYIPKSKTQDINYNDPNNKAYRVYSSGSYSAYWDILDRIDQKRAECSSNYDAILAKVVNFSWEIGENGVYDITLKLISVGDVIESIKANVRNAKLIPDENPNNTSENSSDGKISLFYKFQSSDIGVHLYKKLSNQSKVDYQSTKTEIVVTNTTINGVGSIYSSGPSFEPVLVSNSTIQTTATVGGVDTQDFYAYYRFGDFLKYVQDELLIYDESETPLIHIDYDTNTNLIYRTPGQISTFPNKCIVGGINFLYSDDKTRTLFPGCQPFPASSIYPDITYAGLLMNVYINFEFILNIVEEKTNEETGDLSIYEFLKAICDGINESLGNLNQIEPVLDEDRLYFIDQAPLPEADKLIELINKKSIYAESPTYFNPYGIGGDNTNNATFIRKFGFKTELTNDFATMATIGAQANGAVVGENATLISKWNVGLTDRIIPVKTDYRQTNITSSNQITAEDIRLLNKKYTEIIYTYTDNRFRNEEQWESDKKIIKAYIDYINQQGAFKNNSVTNTTLGFIPLNLNMTCEGISGPKIYQQFKMDAGILPPKYPETLRFLIRGLTHTIQNNYWETSFDTLSIPEQVEVYNDSIFAITSAQIGENLNKEASNFRKKASGDCIKASSIKLSTNYTLADLSCAALASSYFLPEENEIKSIPQPVPRNPITYTRQQLIDNLKAVAENIAEPIRARFPSIIITSGYRDKGSTTSQHEIGQAIDIQFRDITGSVSNQNDLMLKRAQEIQTILKGKKGYDQFLLEYKTTDTQTPWIHISYRNDGKNRNEIRTFLNDVTARNGNGRFYNPLKR